METHARAPRSRDVSSVTQRDNFCIRYSLERPRSQDREIIIARINGRAFFFFLFFFSGVTPVGHGECDIVWKTTVGNACVFYTPPYTRRMIQQV